jgi:ATP-binding cassette subfamily B protein
MPKKTQLKTKLRRTLAQLSYLPQTFRLVWDAAHNWTLAWVILLVVQGLLPVATVYLTRYLVNSLVAIVGKGKSWDNLQPI